MIRPEWSRGLARVRDAELSVLVDGDAKVAGRLPAFGAGFSSRDIAALEQFGVPSVPGYIFPRIGDVWNSPGSEPGIVLATRDDGLNGFTGEPTPEGPAFFFVVSEITGQVVLVSNQYNGYRWQVNASVQRFVESAWRFLHLSRILAAVQYSGTAEVPFADEEETQAVQTAAWDCMIQAEPDLAAPGENSFWWEAVWNYS